MNGAARLVDRDRAAGAAARTAAAKRDAGRDAIAQGGRNAERCGSAAAANALRKDAVRVLSAGLNVAGRAAVVDADRAAGAAGAAVAAHRERRSAAWTGRERHRIAALAAAAAD